MYLPNSFLVNIVVAIFTHRVRFSRIVNYRWNRGLMSVAQTDKAVSGWLSTGYPWRSQAVPDEILEKIYNG